MLDAIYYSGVQNNSSGAVLCGVHVECKCAMCVWSCMEVTQRLMDYSTLERQKSCSAYSQPNKLSISQSIHFCRIVSSIRCKSSGILSLPWDMHLSLSVTHTQRRSENWQHATPFQQPSKTNGFKKLWMGCPSRFVTSQLSLSLQHACYRNIRAACCCRPDMLRHHFHFCDSLLMVSLSLSLSLK